MTNYICFWNLEPFYLFCKFHWMLMFQPLLTWSRVVESVGEGVTELTKGDLVVPIFLADCGECLDCKSSRSNLCSNFPFEFSPWMPRDGTSRFKDSKGEIIQHFMFVSSFSEYTVIDTAHLTKVDLPIPPKLACLLGCGISTGNFLNSYII